MTGQDFQRSGIREVWQFCAAVQIFAVIAAVAATARESAHLMSDLVGFTLLLQGAVAVHLGCRWCSRHALRRAQDAQASRGQERVQDRVRLLVRSACAAASEAAGPVAGPMAGPVMGLAAGVGILSAGGRYLPGAAGELPVAVQAVVATAACAASLYATALHRCNRRLRRSELEARSHLLTQRLRHHFLFNALNTTVCLIQRHPDVAMRTLSDLSELFRVMLKQKPTTTLGEETEFVRRYICIERIRLGNRLGVEWRVSDAECMSVKVPTMVIQPLVENAVYHGIETQDQGGIIRIDIEARDEHVFFSVRNPVGEAGLFSHGRGNRMAQKSVRERLTHAYGDACRFTSKQGGGEYRVTFSIPKEKI